MKKNGLIITNYNALVIQSKSKPVAKPIVHYTMTKQPLTYLNHGKIGNANETCHNMKKEKPIVHVVPTKVVEPITKVTTQNVKPFRIPLRYLCIIHSSFKHCAHDCLKKT